MKPFTTLSSRIIALPFDDIDTDQIIPARFLKVIDRAGLADGLFSGWRYLADGRPNPSFALNRPEYRGAQLLLAGRNFGCGSSREHAPWALAGWGLRAIIARSFGDIFRNNAYKNGLLPMEVDAQSHAVLLALCSADPLVQIGIDLPEQAIRLPGGEWIGFQIDAFNKLCLIEGLDQLGYILHHEAQISAFEGAHENSTTGVQPL